MGDNPATGGERSEFLVTRGRGAGAYATTRPHAGRSQAGAGAPSARVVSREKGLAHAAFHAFSRGDFDGGDRCGERQARVTDGAEAFAAGFLHGAARRGVPAVLSRHRAELPASLVVPFLQKW